MLTGVLWRIFQADKPDGCKEIVLAETIKLRPECVDFSSSISGD